MPQSWKLTMPHRSHPSLMSPSQRSFAADTHVTGARSVHPVGDDALHVVYACEQSRVFVMPPAVSVATSPAHCTEGDPMAAFHQHPSS